MSRVDATRNGSDLSNRVLSANPPTPCQTARGPDPMKERGLAPTGPASNARGVQRPLRRRRPLVDAGYDGRQIVGIDLHRRRSVIVRMDADTGQRLDTVRIDNNPAALAEQIAKAGEAPEVVL